MQLPLIKAQLLALLATTGLAMCATACNDDTGKTASAIGDTRGDPLFPDVAVGPTADTTVDGSTATTDSDSLNPPGDTTSAGDDTTGPGGPTACQPGNRVCQGDFGDEVWLCRDDGSGRDLLMQCQGETVCANGLCQIPCTGDIKHNTNVGCDYFAVDLQNGPPAADYTPGSAIAGNAQFAVVVSNPDRDRALRVTVHEVIGGPSIQAIDLPAGALEVIPLGPRNIEGSVQGMMSYYIAGNRPFVAYQFNPLDNTSPVYSNDASLLLPASGVGRDYIVMTGPGEAFITVVATRDNTEVTIRPTRATDEGPGVPAIDGGGTLTRTLRKGEVLNVKTTGAVDLSGSRVNANQDIIVFGGSTWWTSQWLSTACCADHMEQQMIPIDGWGKTAVAIKAEPRGREVDYWRIIAADDGTTITFDPPVSEPVTINSGGMAYVPTRESFVATANKRIQMGQVLASSYEIGAQDLSCANDASCPDGQTCYSGRCRAPCVATRSNCPAGGICVQPTSYFSAAGQGLCLPDRCSGLSCPSGSACDGQSCQPTCTTDANCPAGRSCRDNGGTRMCMPTSCNSDNDCPSEATCYPGSNGKACLPKCQIAPLCPDAGFICTPSRLVEGSPFSGDLCFEPQCRVDNDCLAGYSCGLGGFCEPIGDPALILTLAVEQFRNSYVFLAPDAYLLDYVSIVAPEGANVTLDDTPITGWQRVGSSSWMYVRRLIADGVHRVNGDRPIGVTVYGYDDDVSYGYPAGTRLADP